MKSHILEKYFLLSLFMLLLLSCNDRSDESLSLDIRLKFAPGAKQQAEVTRVIVVISGMDMDIQEIELDVEGRKAMGMIAIPAGEEKLVRVRAYSGDNLEYSGEAYIDHPKPGAVITLEIQLNPIDSADEGNIIFNNGNAGAVDNGPTSSTIFRLDGTYNVIKIVTYHWNYGQGATPGTISVEDANGRNYGMWDAYGTDGQGGVKNAYWNVDINITLPPGTYTIIDSDPDTWSQNDQSNGQGFATVIGYPAGFLPPPEPDTITGDDGMIMALIPEGKFEMGSEEGAPSEKPVHTVYLDAFYMDIYEVTNAMYEKFMQAEDYPAPEYWDEPNYNAPDNPVVGVSWQDANVYATWAGKRLPTEAEWEKAARGGLVGKRYPWGDNVSNDYANYAGVGGRDKWLFYQTSPVGSFDPNGYGLYDMAGNVWEWCSDNYLDTYYSRSPDRNPKGPDSGFGKVIRGGSWMDEELAIRVYRRAYDLEDSVYTSTGFRCVKSYQSSGERR